MSEYKQFILILAIVGIIGILTMVGRVVYFLFSRKTLDLAATEMKWYIGASLLIFLVCLMLTIITGEAPLGHGGKISFESSPFMFIFMTLKILIATAICVYAFIKVMRSKSWVVKIRK